MNGIFSSLAIIANLTQPQFPALGAQTFLTGDGPNVTLGMI